METARTSISSNSSDDSFSQNIDLQNAIADFVTITVNEILKGWETEMEEEIENEIERRVAITITEFTNSADDQQLINMIARQSVIINKLLEKQMAVTMNQIGLLGKIEELYGKIMKTEPNVKELADQTTLIKPILLDTNSLNSHPTMPNFPETEKQIQETDPNLAFFAARIPFGLTCPPPKLPLVEFPEEEMPQNYFSYGAPPEQFPDFPNLIHRLFAKLHVEKMN